MLTVGLAPYIMGGPAGPAAACAALTSMLEPSCAFSKSTMSVREGDIVPLAAVLARGLAWAWRGGVHAAAEGSPVELRPGVLLIAALPPAAAGADTCGEPGATRPCAGGGERPGPALLL